VPRTLPPLKTFRFFEAVARHLHFTHAAEEMLVTHGAVSQRIKRLEQHLGTSLFRRSGRGVLLTDEGRRLLERVRTAISEIAEEVEAIRSGDRDRILTTSMLPGFAAYWLLPRLAEFIERHPDIEVNIRATLSLTDFIRDGVDMAVRFGPGAWPGLISIKLYDEELVPVCI
jgi:LysR family glycine cleavage system transcriptional activator